MKAMAEPLPPRQLQPKCPHAVQPAKHPLPNLCRHHAHYHKRTRKPQADHQNSDEAKHDATSGQRCQQDRQRGRIRQYPARNAECYQHRKPRAFFCHQIKTMRVPGSPTMAVPDLLLCVVVRMFVRFGMGMPAMVVMRMVVS